MSSPTITLPNAYITNVKSDILKGNVDLTVRCHFSLELMKLRPQLIEMEDQPLDVTLTRLPNLLDEIERKSSGPMIEIKNFGEIPA